MMKLPKQRPKTIAILRISSGHDKTNTTIGIPTRTNGLKNGDLTLLFTYIIYHRTINLWPKRDTPSSQYLKSCLNHTKYLHPNLKENMA